MRFKTVVASLAMVLGFSGCDSSTNISKNIIKQEEKQMLNEIYDSKIRPDGMLYKQDNRTEVDKIILNYISIGQHRQDIIKRLNSMDIQTKKNEHGIVRFGELRQGIGLAIILNVELEFNGNDKLKSIKSQYFYQE
jgi:hypothetical protein